MPEQLSKHPEVTIQVLRSAGAKCGEGAAQEILVACPTGRFCKLPGGEVCVYGLPEAKQMTQISAVEWQAVAAVSEHRGSAVSAELVAAGAFLLLLGLVVGILWARHVNRKRARLQSPHG
jgi:hypothetical protein